MWLFMLALTGIVLVRPARAEGSDEAKRHFTNGVHLFEDRNFAGALVEFEASFQQNPTAAALQNIAVCQKGLFRYAEAIATLEGAMKEATQFANDIAKQENEDALAKVKATGKTQIIELGPEEKKAWKKALIKVHRESEATIGKALIQEIYKETGFDPAKL